MHPILLFVASVLMIVLMDSLWLGVLMKQFYASHITMVQPLRLWAGVLVWILMALGLMVFILPRSSSYISALMYGALFGFIVYGIYDFTNHAFLVQWPLVVVVVDILWGTFLYAVISCAIYALQQL